MDWLQSVKVGQCILETKEFSGSWLSIDDCHWQPFAGEFKNKLFEHLRWKVNSEIGFTKNSKVNVMSGLVFITNYRIVLISSLSNTKITRSVRYDPPTFFDELSIPLSSVLRITETSYGISMYTKDNRIINFFAVKGIARNVTTQFVNALKKEISAAYHVFAYKNRLICKVDGWDYVDARPEYGRMGLISGNGWSVSWTRFHPVCMFLPHFFIICSDGGQ
jgi:hypothetical protein